MKKRINVLAALLLSVALLAGCLPVTVDAAEESCTAEDSVAREADPEELASNASLTSSEESAELWMKLRVNYCYNNGTRLPLLTGDGGAYGAPMEVEGEVMLPLLPMLDFMGFGYQVSAGADSVTVSEGNTSVVLTVGESRAAIGGSTVELTTPMAYYEDKAGNRYLVINRGDVSNLFPGWYLTYDEMGLCILSRTENIYDRYDDLDVMLRVMKEFVFDYPSGEQIAADVSEYTDGFDHPYILTNEEELAYLRSIYLSGKAGEEVDRDLMATLASYVNLAEVYYKKYALPSEDPAKGYSEWVGLNEEEKPINPYSESGGYDPEGGRLEILEEYAGVLMDLAIGYQLSGDDRYVYCGYYIMLALGEWEHWGPGHMLNTADSAFEISVFFDWTYDACVRLGLDVGRLEDILYEKAVYQGWRGTNGMTLLYPRPGFGNLSRYNTMTNNWNAVCTSGLGITALAIMGNEDYREISSKLLSSNLESMIRVGLDPYAPDGTYIEGTQYWGYATNVFFTLCMALDNAAGTDYGLMNCWGIEQTSYFACHTESSDLRMFNYNDASDGKQCTYFFFYCANKYDDPVLRSIRLAHIEAGKNCAIYDMLEYPFEGVDADVSLPLDYSARAIDIYTARSGWERGSLFVGIMGGNNNVGHGHIDAGSFVYHNHGSVWLLDLGSDNYNVFGYWNDNYRYRYYRLNAEGHNTLCLTSAPDAVPHGQVLNSTSPITAFEQNGYGSFVTYDMTAAFGGYATEWRRGMLLTNGRETVVVQDQVKFDGPQTVYWFAHYSTDTVERVTVSKDGRTVYLDGQTDVYGRSIRLSIVGDEGLKFELMSCYELVNVGSRGTYTADEVEANGLAELSRDGYMKLAIKGSYVDELNLAVVIESVDTAREIEVGYEWQDMSLWSPTEDLRTEYYVPPVSVPTRDEASTAKLGTLQLKCDKYLRDGEAYTERLSEYYRSLTDIAYVFDEIPTAKYNGTYREYYSVLEERRAAYDGFVALVNGVADHGRRFVQASMPMSFGES